VDPIPDPLICRESNPGPLGLQPGTLTTRPQRWLAALINISHELLDWTTYLTDDFKIFNWNLENYTWNPKRLQGITKMKFSFSIMGLF
jgi:hypothetical protein